MPSSSSVLQLVDWMSAHVVAPVLGLVHAETAFGDPRAVAQAMLVSLVQIAIIAAVFRPLESLAPAERWADRRLTRIDRLYTGLMLLGLFPLFSYLVLEPLGHLLGAGTGGGTSHPHDLRHAVPWLDHHPWILLAVYYVVYDLVYYWMHRVQHWIPWWWALHSMHHSQRQMSCWTNDRGSYLDGALQSFVLAAVGVAFGVDIDDFALLTLASELVQNFSHTNVRFGFGRVLERVLVDPRFHRLHHMVADPERPGLHDCNFGQVLSIWDVLFGTALYGEPVRPTGVRDPRIDADNERGLIAMQWWTLRRFWRAFSCRAGWRPGEVSFGADDAPTPQRTAVHA